jgi:hypothetical protein
MEREGMIEAWATQRYVRIFLTGSFLVGGFAVATLLIRQNDFVTAIVIFSVGLAALVGAGKLASP